MPLTLLLRCRDLKETRELYQSMLGCSVRDAAEGTRTAEQQGDTLIFTAGDRWDHPPGCSGIIYVTVSDAEGDCASVTDMVAVARPIQTMAYDSRAFGIRDGNRDHVAFQQQAKPGHASRPHFAGRLNSGVGRHGGQDE